MSSQRDFYTEMRNAIRRSPDLAEVSPEVWDEFCRDITPEPMDSFTSNSQVEIKAIVDSYVEVEIEAKVEAPKACAIASVDSMGWAELSAIANSCSDCALKERRTNVVFGEGNQDAELMFIGEGPGAEEDAQGRPFVGAAGQLLDKMIIAMQYSREEVYIANVVKCRPEGNRVPTPDEAAACMRYLKRQIELVNPKVIVLLGATPLQFLMNLSGIKRHRGEFLSYNDIPVMPTFHPAYLLRSPDDKRLVWNDLKQVMALLGKSPKK